MTQVITTKGLVAIDQLSVSDIVTIEGHTRVTATEWRLGGELVRRDVNVNVLKPLEIGALQGDI